MSDYTPTIYKDSPIEDIKAVLEQRGETLPDDMSREDALDYLGAVTGVDYTKLSSPESRTPSKRRGRAKAAPKAQAAPKKAKATRRIIIPSNEGPMGSGDVFVGYNGVGYQLRRDTEIDVPLGVLDVLRDARTRTGRATEDGDIVWMDAPTYPFQIVD